MNNDLRRRSGAQATGARTRSYHSLYSLSAARLITALRAKHAAGGNETWGIDGEKGVLADMKDVGVWEPYLVKTQTIKTAIESAQMLLRIDAVVSGVARKG